MGNLRKPMALANWKMAMTVTESISFAGAFRTAVGDLVHAVDIVLCPPYTALYPLYQVLGKTPITIGAQDFCAESGKSQTGQISAPLLADAGCKWVMVGHWEVRRRTGEDDKTLNRKVHAALQAGLRPILLVGEAVSQKGRLKEALATRMPGLLAQCEVQYMAEAAMIYEPEWTIDGTEPAPPDYITEGCGLIRHWTARACGKEAAEGVRIIYGGSVTPENAERLLASSEVDGLGAGRKGRDAAAFAQIVTLIARVKEGAG